MVSEILNKIRTSSRQCNFGIRAKFNEAYDASTAIFIKK